MACPKISMTQRPAHDVTLGRVIFKVPSTWWLAAAFFFILFVVIFLRHNGRLTSLASGEFLVIDS